MEAEPKPEDEDDRVAALERTVQALVKEVRELSSRIKELESQSRRTRPSIPAAPPRFQGPPTTPRRNIPKPPTGPEID